MMNLNRECRMIEARHPGWHVWWSDAGKPWATHDYHDAFGCGATVTAAGFPRMDKAIALFEREREREIARMTPLAFASAA